MKQLGKKLWFPETKVTVRKHTLTCRHVVHAIEVREARLVPSIVGRVDECSDSIPSCNEEVSRVACIRCTRWLHT